MKKQSRAGGPRLKTIDAANAAKVTGGNQCREEPDGTELHLERNDNPAAKAYQQALFEQGQPAAMFYTDDVKRDYERMKDAAEFKMPPTKVTGSTIAQANDGCGNLIQITQLDRVRSEAGRK